ncbi:hypothetical protein BJB45_19315 [Halomonas huangheensis]|uniref:HTH lysR-type domain-containing protein n=2 Tax=Halomonas huangheensis TaxID=1178482 RepID=W1N597_9GAMM|nr:hypothetical protein BJB45_19315 [Halomonas huangheensis]
MQCFETAARHLSFTRAAEELNITQSAVSKQVAQLEDVLQRKLFRRLRRSLVLTPEGALYLSEARKILAQIEMSTNTIQTWSGEGEVLKVATLPTFGSRWLAHHLPDFLDAHPQLALQLSDRVEAFDLNGEGIDIAVFHGHGSWSGLECHRLFDEDVVAVASPHYLTQKRPDAGCGFAKCRLLHLDTRPAAWHQWFADQGIRSERSYYGTRVETFHTLIQMLINGAGLGLVPRFLIHQELESGQLALASPHVLTSPDAYYLVTPEALGEQSRVRHFIDYMIART